MDGFFRYRWPEETPEGEPDEVLYAVEADRVQRILLVYGDRRERKSLAAGKTETGSLLDQPFSAATAELSLARLSASDFEAAWSTYEPGLMTPIPGVDLMATPEELSYVGASTPWDAMKVYVYLTAVLIVGVVAAVRACTGF